MKRFFVAILFLLVVLIGLGTKEPDIKKEVLPVVKSKPKRYSWAMIGCISSLIIVWDYYVWSGWQWVFEHNTCYIHDMATGELMKQIYWNVSPQPMILFTLGSIVVSVYWIYKVIVNYIESKGEK